MSLCCVTMKLAVCLMLAFTTSCASSPGCHCDFTNRQYKGILRYSSGTPRAVVEGNFNADLDGYYFRAYINHPNRGPMHFYKDNSHRVLCYEDLEYCNRDEDLIVDFPECVSNRSKYEDGVYVFQKPILGRTFYETYGTRTQPDGTCKLNSMSWSLKEIYGNYRTYSYRNIAVDVKRQKSFYLQEIKKFSGMNIDDIISG